MFNTPILFIVFNRLSTTKQVFERIKVVKPKYLFIAADGPRKDKPDDEMKCAEVQNFVLGSIDWDCEVKTLFRNENLGCGRGPAEAISWFFENVEMGIILEDDCLPDITFFGYCQELLQKYTLNDKIMNISGSNLNSQTIDSYSYYFSNYNHTWGWATWRRAWENYQFDIFKEDQSIFTEWITALSFSSEEGKYWLNIFLNLKENSDSIWDYQWLFTVWKFKGISITPKCNLVSNVGFGKGATHTLDETNPFSKTPTSSIQLPLKHPSLISINNKLDLLFAKEFLGISKFTENSFWRRVYRKSKTILTRIIKPTEKISDHYPKQLGIPKNEIKRLRNSQVRIDSSTIFNCEIKIIEPFWHLHSLNEIFIEEVYKFVAETKEPVIIDCGANVGLSVLFFKRLYPLSKMTAFEPDKKIFKMLSQNLESLNITDVTIVNKAVWKEDGILEFLSSGALGGKIYNVNQGKSHNFLEEIESVRLRSYLTTPVDFLKIDIEGAEFEVLNDCKDVLHNVKNLFVEYHSDPNQEQMLNELLYILKETGFRVYIKESWNNLPIPFLHQQYKPYYDLQLNIFAYRSKK